MLSRRSLSRLMLAGVFISMHALAAEPGERVSAPLKPAPVQGLVDKPAPAAVTTGAIGEDGPLQSQPLGDDQPQAPASGSGELPAAPLLSQQNLDELIALGLPSLARSIIEQQQAQTRVFTPDWYRLERKRISVLVQLEQWDRVATRAARAIDDNPDFRLLPVEMVDWFRTQQAIALLNDDRGEAALGLLRQMIWSTARYDRRVIFALWRRLVISAYLQQENIADAESAMLRYGYDYRDSDFALTEDWKITRAGVLMRLQRYAEVQQLLQSQATPIEQQYYLLAGMRLQPAAADKLAARVKELASGKIIDKKHRWAYRYLLYEAALASKDEAASIQALEDLLSVGKVSHPLQRVVKVDADAWWQYYRDKGIELGNQYRLLRGDDSAWYGKAIELRKSNREKATALLVELGLHSQDLNHRQLTHIELISILEKRKNSLDLLTQLYLHSSYINSLQVIPVSVRARLIDHALDKKDIPAAARLMQSLREVPAEQDPFVWRLRKARVLILEGQHGAGEMVLATLFDALPEMTAERLDRILQVLFDLQSVQRHHQALRFFQQLAGLELSFQLRRELFYWMAQSHHALSQYDSAAMYYLRSARGEDGGMNDQWALSSRLKAAESLVKAGLYDDAETLYQQLLKVTANVSRKALIEQELQQITLLRNASQQGAR